MIASRMLIRASARLLLALGSVVMSVAQATDYNRDIPPNSFFTDEGKPLPSFVEQVKAQTGLVLLSGMTIEPKYQDEDGVWQYYGGDACITLKFRISPEGVPDLYQILDENPAGAFKAGLVGSIKNWRFSKSEKGAWMLLPMSYIGTHTNLQDSSRDSRIDSSKFRPRPTCAVPTVRRDLSVAEGVQLLGDALLPTATVKDVRAGTQGCATVAFAIRPDGSTADFEALDSKPAGTYDLVSALAISAWKFNPQPALAVNRKGIVRFNYRLEGKPEPTTQCMDTPYAFKNYSLTPAKP